MIDDQLSFFPQSQKDLIGLIRIIDGPVPEEAVEKVIETDPDQFSVLANDCIRKGWIRRIEKGGKNLLCPGTNLTLGSTPLPPFTGNPQGIETIKNLGLEGYLAFEKVVDLLTVMGSEEETAAFCVDCAHKASKQGKYKNAFRFMLKAVKSVFPQMEKTFGSGNHRFAHWIIELDDLSILSGEEIPHNLACLEAAESIAKQSNDTRSLALAMLKRGWRMHGKGEFTRGMALLYEGKKKVQALGDEDILEAAALYLAVYEMRMGRHDLSLAYLEQVESVWDVDKGMFAIDSHPMLLKSVLMWIRGDFNLSIGTLENMWQTAMKNKKLPAAVTARLYHALCLTYVDRRSEALRLIREARAIMEDTPDVYASALIAFARARLCLNQDQTKAAYRLLRPLLIQMQQGHPLHTNFSILASEHIVGFYYQDFDPIPGWELHRLIDRCLTDPSILFQGAGLRMRAELALHEENLGPQVDADLTRSEALLRKAGALRYLALTWIVMARKCLIENDLPRARKLAQKVKSVFSQYRYSERLFPADLKHLIDKPESDPGITELEEHLLERHLDFVEDIILKRNTSKFAYQVVRGASHVFGTERGALLGFHLRDPEKPPTIIATCNMSEQEILGSEFEESLELAKQAFLKNLPQLTKPTNHRTGSKVSVKCRFCIPFQFGDGILKVLYLENLYLNNPFERLPSASLNRIARRSSRFIGRLMNRPDSHGPSPLAAVEQRAVALDTILAQSPIVLDVLDQADRAAVTSSTVLIIGETGTGKELLASRIHRFSRRSEGPFIVVDAATIPESILESELFGHEKGAFTGAERRKRGLVESADKGTLFIDEIGELPMSMQAKLLRTFEAKTFRRVGGIQNHQSDFRLVAATNRNLADEVANSRFRQDLYYRLNVLTLELPPLRDRIDDIMLLSSHFLKKFSKRAGKLDLRFTAEQEKTLESYLWPGNVRELKNVIERAVILSSSGQLQLDFPARKSTGTKNPFQDMVTMEEMQRRYIRHVLNQTKSRISGPRGAAEILGMKRQTLTARMKRLGMR